MSPQFWPPVPTDSGWGTIPLASGWSALGSPNRGASMRIRDGIVYVSLAVLNSSATSSGATLGTLPVSARPSAVVHAVCRSVSLAPIVIYPSGVIEVAAALGAGTGVFGLTAFPLG